MRADLTNAFQSSRFFMRPPNRMKKVTFPFLIKRPSFILEYRNQDKLLKMINQKDHN